MTSPQPDPLKILQQSFGYQKFRHTQAKIIDSVLTRKDTLVVLPTGGGKSLCYQIPGLIFPGQTLVITPLVSLMEDQVAALRRRGIAATFLNAQLPKKELQQRLQNLTHYKFIYLTPERLNSKSWQKLAQNLTIDLMAIDEAHCISEWGHDFRPPYLTIGKYLNKLPKRPTVIALTASATPLTQTEICQRLHFEQPNLFIASPQRPNLNLQIKTARGQFEQEFLLLLALQQHPGQSGIIYAQTREKTVYLTELIKHYFPNQQVACYHAGLGGAERSQIQTAFLTNRLSLIVATTAFGMGVDKANLRFVIHIGVPTSIESYYQEVGRAGRDGQPANCYLFHRPTDWEIATQIISSSTVHLKQKKLKLRQLQIFLQAKTCLHQSLVTYFSSSSSHKELACQNCSHCSPTQLGLPANNLTLGRELLNLRTTLAKKYRISPLEIMTDQILLMTTLTKPLNTAAFLKIPGVGKGWVERFAGDIIPVICRCKI